MRFYLLVIGNDLYELLEHYRIFDGTEETSRFVQNVDVTADVVDRVSRGHTLKEALMRYGINDPISDESQVDIDKKHKYGYAIVKNDTLVKVIDRTNPNGKFDECWLGSFVPGIFILKPHCRGVLGMDSKIELEKMDVKNIQSMADQAYKKDIDFEETRNRAGLDAQKLFERVEAFYGGSIPQLSHFWNDPVYDGLSFDETREQYHNQEAM